MSPQSEQSAFAFQSLDLIRIHFLRIWSNICVFAFSSSARAWATRSICVNSAPSSGTEELESCSISVSACLQIFEVREQRASILLKNCVHA